MILARNSRTLYVRLEVSGKFLGLIIILGLRPDPAERSIIVLIGRPMIIIRFNIIMKRFLN